MIVVFACLSNLWTNEVCLEVNVIFVAAWTWEWGKGKAWQSQWEETMKGAITEGLFPSVETRLAVNLNLSPKVATIMTGHGNIRSYLRGLEI